MDLKKAKWKKKHIKIPNSLLLTVTGCHVWSITFNIYEEIFLLIIIFVSSWYISHQEDIKSNGKKSEHEQHWDVIKKKEKNNNNLKETDFNIYFHDIPFGQFLCLPWANITHKHTAYGQMTVYLVDVR